MEHLLEEVHREELFALADAGEFLDLRRAAVLAAALNNPTESARPFDGGARARAETKSAALIASRQGL